MESHDQNQGERQAQDQNQDGRQESLPMITGLPQDDQNQDGRQAHQQQNMDVTETQLRHEEARHILQQAGRTTGHDPHALRVYRGNWRGAQERSLLRKMIEDLNMKDAIDRLNESPDVNVRMLQQHRCQAMANYQPINPLVRSPMVHPVINSRLLTPALAFLPVNYAMNPAETMEGNNNSTTTVLRTRDLLSNFGRVNNYNVRDDVQPPVEVDDNNTLRGFDIEHGESSAGPREELREIDFLGLGNRSGADDNNGVDLNLSL